MIYCKKCSRILETNVSVCPFCGNREDGDASEQAPHESVTLQMLNERIEQNKRLRELELVENQEREQIQKIVSDFEARARSVEYGQPGFSGQHRIGQGPIGRNSVNQVPPQSSKDTLGVRFKVAMILLALFFTLPGLVVGIVFMTRPDKAQKKWGLTMLIVAIVSMLFWLTGYCLLATFL